jgi:WASH complex subunit 7
MAGFVEAHANQLQKIEEALDETLSENWDPITDPVNLSLQPYEQTNILELIRTDNKVFNKVIIIFSALIQEVAELKETVSIHFCYCQYFIHC